MARKQSKKAPVDPGIIITPATEKDLSAAQTEFNRLMKRLETARIKHTKEQAKLDKMLVSASTQLMPLIEACHRTNYEIIIEVSEALGTVKLSKKRRDMVENLLSRKAQNLLTDPSGLEDKEISEVKDLLDELDPYDPNEPFTEDEAEEFKFLKDMMASAAAKAGLDLDLSDLDASTKPEDFERILQERLLAAAEKQEAEPAKPTRKQTKAQVKKAAKMKEQDDAKKRDLKSLYKQLAKALHPDLESDPTLKNQKEDWMKRLTTAYADGDLRALLQIEMEWLGEEASNLASASDEKLKVYSAVLKEQIREQKARTEWLADEPQYSTIRRFTDPYTGKLAAPTRVLRDLEGNLDHHASLLKDLRKSKTGCRIILEAWADEHERSMLMAGFF